MTIFKRRRRYLVVKVLPHDWIVLCSFEHCWQANAYIAAF